MNRDSLVDSVSQKTGHPKIYVREILRSTFESITEALFESQKTTINSFGTFQVKSMPRRKARNPSTGETIIVEAKNVVKFKPSPLLLKKKKK